MDAVRATKAQITQINREEYDDATDLYWQLTVYDAVHAGWWFANIGGRHVLDFIGTYAPLSDASQVLEFCSGLGDAGRYLAERFGCRVTGLEVNARQVAAARARLRRFDSKAASGIRFLHEDVLTWQPEQRFDVVYALDSLMLLDKATRAMATARRALVSGGAFLLADVIAGPELTTQVREFVWKEDGIIHLPTQREQEQLLRSARFQNVYVEDLTDAAAECFIAVAAASIRCKDLLVLAKGGARFSRWTGNALRYAEYFVDRKLRYLLFAAEAS